MTFLPPGRHPHPRPVRPRLHPADLPPPPRPDRRRHPHSGVAHRRQPAPHPEPVWPCPPHHLPARRGRPGRLPPLPPPGRRFVFVVGSGYGTYEAARFVHRRRPGCRWPAGSTGSSLFEPRRRTAVLGRPRVEGKRRPKPCEAARRRLTVGWYDGGRRRVSVVTGAGYWHRPGLNPLGVITVGAKTGCGDRAGLRKPFSYQAVYGLLRGSIDRSPFEALGAAWAGRFTCVNGLNHATGSLALTQLCA